MRVRRTYKNGKVIEGNKEAFMSPYPDTEIVSEEELTDQIEKSNMKKIGQDE